MIFLVDFDGTISINDTIDVMLELFASKEYLAIEMRWKNNEISSMECMKRQFELIRAEEAALINYMDSIDIDLSFIDFCHYALKLGAIAIASDGIDYPIRKILEKHQINNIPVFANKIKIIEGGASISFPYASNCIKQSGCCKCSVSRNLCITQKKKIVLIGNGQSDMCLAERADVVFAKDSLKDFCISKGIPFNGFNSFMDIVVLMKKWKKPEHSWALNSSDVEQNKY
ncbi:MtnX-like HAD-IB family phosphatase [Legionella maioricensis]|uniref:MtnX-like HAD-IB family phosphatase n=1 Tax=Legionella maioricensis TaxID=2896528 RepID=A0A9X2D0W8_9GAMM|nr:MtnX-like HAD-IB family phosphatase [Legionella maioricensis]MCL9684272.1 MtnX-like HAD-IB family phosphatase [Legionella maioricensis]MCL9687138.1 MtnX-like HAD-IB family phosphatase [Legionella maioricensis]